MVDCAAEPAQQLCLGHGAPSVMRAIARTSRPGPAHWQASRGPDVGANLAPRTTGNGSQGGGTAAFGTYGHPTQGATPSPPPPPRVTPPPALGMHSQLTPKSSRAQVSPARCWRAYGAKAAKQSATGAGGVKHKAFMYVSPQEWRGAEPPSEQIKGAATRS
jgi:hypothetical protein